MTLKVYHGSTVCVSEPSLQPITRRLDFGAGFYVTSDIGQARRWARIKKRRVMAEQAVVSIYDAALVFADQIVFVTKETLAMLKYEGFEEVQDE